MNRNRICYSTLERCDLYYNAFHSDELFRIEEYLIL